MTGSSAAAGSPMGSPPLRIKLAWTMGANQPAGSVVVIIGGIARGGRMGVP